jgi:hypothetical protein
MSCEACFVTYFLVHFPLGRQNTFGARSKPTTRRAILDQAGKTSDVREP